MVRRFVDPQLLLAALAEPNRFRIVELLAIEPRSVGEIALLLGARQPQTTKHLQTLEAAGIVTIHRLGRRRVAMLRRDALRALSVWLSDLGDEHPSESVLDAYARSIERAQHDLEAEPAQRSRRFDIQRTMPGSPRDVWHAWTTAELIRRWWSPDHFAVAECEIEPVAGGILRIVIEEGDGTRYTASGTILALEPDRRLTFTLSPLGPGDIPLFHQVHEVEIDGDTQTSTLAMTITVTDIVPEAAPALAGIPIGWEQCLDKLATVLRDGLALRA